MYSCQNLFSCQKTKKSLSHSEVRKALYRSVRLVPNLYTYLITSGHFTQSNNNQVANQVQIHHLFDTHFLISAAKVHISDETDKQFVTFFADYQQKTD